MIWVALVLGIAFTLAAVSAFAWLILYLAWLSAWLVAIAGLAGLIWVGFKAWQHSHP